ncbi:nuclear transport factor 2 family protein [Croceicoccus bisphenolivorans]|uniref:nuclear transport factor 2 family protein n=1 Tax=Croceicoccus bisphenolivorans TaxID=1783232 RepID=UPI00082B7FB2|nr:hypothetical protein [Croceicoccus bisphenolivorans]
MTKEQAASTVIAQIVEGRVDTGLFTDDGAWWSNAGVSIPIADFNQLLTSLHEQTEHGIAVTAGPIAVCGDKLFFEATSQARLKNGKAYANRYAFVALFEGDLIREMREYSDTAHVFDTFEIAL